MFTLRIHTILWVLVDEEREQTQSAQQNPAQLGFRAVLVDWQLTEGD